MDNTEKLVYYKKWYQDNKEAVKEVGEKKVICEVCGRQYSYWNSSHHKKTQTHIRALAKQETSESDAPQVFQLSDGTKVIIIKQKTTQQ